MILLIDNYDSFTYNLVDYFQQIGVTVSLVRNDVPIEDLSEYSFDGLVLSPGPQTPNEAGNLLQIINLYHTKKPILGVCLGHQALGAFFGAQIVRSLKPMHGKVSKVEVKEDYLFTGISRSFYVVRYHSLELKSLPDELESIAWTNIEEIMAIRHKYLPLRGIQFHPEAYLTKQGMKMLKNWVDYNKLRF